MSDYPNRKQWLAIRHTPASLHRTRVNRIVYAGGTYVRRRGTTEDARLAWYQRQCNANAAPGSRRVRRVAK